MAFRLRKTDCTTLECIADHRMLTVSQVAVIFGKSRHVVRRRLHDLEEGGMVQVVGTEFGRSRGRPENSLGLTEQGVGVLRDRGLLGRDIPCEKVLADCLATADHQLLLNWFRIHLKEVERVLPRLSVRFLAHSSPYLPRGSDGPVSISDCSPVPGRGTQQVRFTPDAVFATCDSGQSKTCLFFLEVDCGTETIASPKREATDIRQKIINYQSYFRSLRYKRYEQVFNCSLHGFRLLLFTHSVGRLTTLCKLVQEMPPSNFIWLSEHRRLLADGASGKIWAKGGNLQGSQESILGSLHCRSPLLYRDSPRLDNVSA
jgi:hypothetical protein